MAEKADPDDRVVVTLRLKRSSLAWVERQAQAREVKNAVIFRELLAYGVPEYERRQAAAKRQVTPLPKGGKDA
jgi:hypothetical protein